MISFVQNLFAAKSNPIGVDYGSDCLRMVQVAQSGSEFKLIAAASTDVPVTARHDPAARLNFFVEASKELMTQGKFRGRECMLGLPAASMFIQHLRMPKLDPDDMKRALPWELRGKLPIDPSHAMLRHIPAGDVYEGQEAKTEVIVIAAANHFVHQLLAAASKAKLDVTGMNVEPKALVDCFTQLYRRKSDEGVTSCYIDIGCVATRAVIARGADIVFARTIPVGGDHFSRATSLALKIKIEEAKILRMKIAQAQPATPEDPQPKPAPVRNIRSNMSIENSFALLAAGLPPERRQETAPPAPAETHVPPTVENMPADPELARQAKLIEEACREPLTRLVDELELCRRYYETTFPNHPVDRLIFVGGEARQKALCQHIARALGIAAQVGDPMVRINKSGDVGVEHGIDRRQPQPGWAVAIGLSLGPASGGSAQSSDAEDAVTANA